MNSSSCKLVASLRLCPTNLQGFFFNFLSKLWKKNSFRLKYDEFKASHFYFEYSNIEIEIGVWSLARKFLMLYLYRAISKIDWNYFNLWKVVNNHLFHWAIYLEQTKFDIFILLFSNTQRRASSCKGNLTSLIFIIKAVIAATPLNRTFCRYWKRLIFHLCASD